MAPGWNDFLSAFLVGAVWGCTNPFLRKGSSEDEGEESVESGSADAEKKCEDPELKSIANSLLRFRRIRVWLPYLLNQGGSLLYYKLLATSDLTLSVPVCNSLALVFSSITSFALGERVDKPLTSMLGAFLVILGVAICMMSNENFRLQDFVMTSNSEL